MIPPDLPRSPEGLLAFARASTANMAKILQETVHGMKADPRLPREFAVEYAKILREQADLVLAAAEVLERE